MRAIVLPEPWKAVTAEREIPVPKQGKWSAEGSAEVTWLPTAASPHTSAIRV